MRAKFIRGQEPKDALNIGLKASLFQKAVDDQEDPVDDSLISPVSVEEYNEGYILLLAQDEVINGGPNPSRFFAIIFDKDHNIVGETPNTSTSEKRILKDARMEIDDFGILGESVNFKRGQEPKDAMGIAPTHIIELPNGYEMEGPLRNKEAVEKLNSRLNDAIMNVQMECMAEEIYDDHQMDRCDDEVDLWVPDFKKLGYEYTEDWQ